ncbi:hypothetical protein [Kitasatospora sp. DSM 101779]|uniref:hypothetical protein n=1 Tax=Kitasatospora sp. DSM 101779 TaxID=2853165 RepID=UPI0021D8F272|nr:hypothetical protein [Kitasatospora sp. DSM 101779]MCU7820664.1 hypothetical protein [Kitasatospora sp. DSM 101779]
MTADVPFSRAARPPTVPGDVVFAPQAMMSGPGPCRDVAPRWRWVQIRLGGGWRAAELTTWRRHHGSTAWVALVRWGCGAADWGWVLYDPAALQPAPEPAAPWPGRAPERPGRPGGRSDGATGRTGRP